MGSTTSRPKSASPLSTDRVASTMYANEELRSRNLALLAKNAQMEEEIMRMHEPPRPERSTTSGDDPPPRELGGDTMSETVKGTLWQFLDVALQGAARARAESRRAHAETLIQLDQSFNPTDKEARLKARALLAQASRASSKLQAAVQQLESEAGAALTAHNADINAWVIRMRRLASRSNSQTVAVEETMRISIEEAERTHHAHARVLIAANDRLEIARAEERSWSKAEVRRLVERVDEVCARSCCAQLSCLHLPTWPMVAALTLHLADGCPCSPVLCSSPHVAQLNATINASSSGAASTQAAMAADSKRLRENLAAVEGELETEKSAHATTQHRYAAIVSQLQQANGKLRDELGTMAAELEQTREELSGKLERLASEKEASTAALRTQLSQLHRQKEAEEQGLTQQIHRLQVEKEASAATLSAQIMALQADREADATHLHGKINRLKTIQTAALAAGSARGRALLYTESLKSPDLLKHSTMTWRGEDWVPAAGGDSVASLHHTPLHYEYEGNAYAEPRAASPHVPANAFETPT